MNARAHVASFALVRELRVTERAMIAAETAGDLAEWHRLADVLADQCDALPEFVRNGEYPAEVTR